MMGAPPARRIGTGPIDALEVAPSTAGSSRTYESAVSSVLLTRDSTFASFSPEPVRWRSGDKNCPPVVSPPFKASDPRQGLSHGVLGCRVERASFD